MVEFTMNDGNKIPALGYGVFQMSSQQVAQALPQAIATGYRHIDTANAYFNEVAVGKAIRESGIDRGEFFVTSKLFPQDYPYEKCKQAIDDTLARLGLDYLDLLLFHQPYGEYVSGWKAMEEAVRDGKVRSIGLSNFTNVAKLREITDTATIEPAVMQILINPYWNAHEYKEQVRDLGMQFEGWYPLGHGDKTMLAEAPIANAAAAHGKSASQVVLRWHLQEGNVVFPKTMNPAHMADNLNIFDFELTDAEMAAINALPQTCGYVVPDEAPAWVWGPNDYSQQA